MLHNSMSMKYAWFMSFPPLSVICILGDPTHHNCHGSALLMLWYLLFSTWHTNARTYTTVNSVAQGAGSPKAQGASRGMVTEHTPHPPASQASAELPIICYMLKPILRLASATPSPLGMTMRKHQHPWNLSPPPPSWRWYSFKVQFQTLSPVTGQSSLWEEPLTASAVSEEGVIQRWVHIVR